MQISQSVSQSRDHCSIQLCWISLSVTVAVQVMWSAHVLTRTLKLNNDLVANNCSGWKNGQRLYPFLTGVARTLHKLYVYQMHKSLCTVDDIMMLSIHNDSWDLKTWWSTAHIPTRVRLLSSEWASISLKKNYDTCVYWELKTKKSPAHIFYKCMASLQCEYGCDAVNHYY